MSVELDPTRVIGVGMGGSCPECRAPLDLGQEYCLECGANVRVRKRVKRMSAVPGGVSAAVVSPRRSSRGGFPWIWFSLLLILAVAGLVSVLVYESSGSHKKPTSHTTQNTTSGVQSSPSNPNNSVQTTPTFPTNTTPSVPGATPTVPTTPITPLHTTPATTVPATTPVSTTPATPVTTTPTQTQTTPTNTTSNNSWPAGKDGYTVVLDSYGKSLYTEADAQQKATEARQHGLTAGVLNSDEYSSLNPGYWVLFSGVYDTQAQAQAHVAASDNAGYAGAYVRQVNG